jgi:hypothetical protein
VFFEEFGSVVEGGGDPAQRRALVAQPLDLRLSSLAMPVRFRLLADSPLSTMVSPSPLGLREKCPVPCGYFSKLAHSRLLSLVTS